MTPAAVLVTVIAYFLVLYLVASLSGRRADNQGFFVGNRRSPWPVVAFAMIGSSISGVTFVSVPGWVQASQFSYLQMALGFVAGQLVIAFVLIPLFYRMGLVSIYQYLESRFGISSYRTGAWFFFLSKMIGAAVRVYLVCLVMQLLVFGPLHVPFVWNVAATMILVWLYTYRGGVKSLIWTDSLKTFCLVASVGLCIYFIASDLHLDFGDAAGAVARHDYSRIFFFDDLNDRRYFFKQFLAGAFTVIAMTGLDQDMMQRNLSCRNYRDSQKNIVTSGVLQLFVILLFLVLGVLLYLYAEKSGIRTPERSDELFPMIATGGYFPAAVGVLFVIGLVSSAYSAAGSALTAFVHGRHPALYRALRRGAHRPRPQTGARRHGCDDGRGDSRFRTAQRHERDRRRLYAGQLYLRPDSRVVRFRHLYPSERARPRDAVGSRAVAGAVLCVAAQFGTLVRWLLVQL